MKQSQFPLFLSWFIVSPSKYFWRGDRQWRKSGIMFAWVFFCQCYSYSPILNIFLMLCSLVSLSQCGSPLVPQQCLCHGAPPPHPTPPHPTTENVFSPQLLPFSSPNAVSGCPSGWRAFWCDGWVLACGGFPHWGGSWPPPAVPLCRPLLVPVVRQHRQAPSLETPTPHQISFHNPCDLDWAGFKSSQQQTSSLR